MPTVKKLVAYHISRLQDKSRDVRLKAVNELIILMEDQDALEALGKVYENDSDEEVRKVAGLAYHKLHLQNGSKSSRLRAIVNLETLGDPSVLQMLQDIFQNDADAEIRKAAQEAGRSIFVKQRKQQTADA
jgi:HEAT repeat protein